MKTLKNDLLFVIGIALGLWFAATGIFWVYWAALMFAYPAGLIALLIWLAIRKDGRKRNIAIPVILLAGLALSLSMLVSLMYRG